MSRLRAVAVWVALTLFAGLTVAAEDWQPHPSHAPPPPPSVRPPAPPPPKFPPPKVIKVVDPRYPPLARRYNAQKTVGLEFSVNADGSVRAVEILNGADEFGESAMRAAKKWRFEKRPEASTVRLAVAFGVNRDEDYAFDTAVRRIHHRPAAAADVGADLVYGFEFVRLMIDVDGKVVGKFVESVRPAEFAASADAIVAMLKFEPVAAEFLRGGKSVNSFLVDYANDGVIRIQQRGGEPAW